MQHCEPLCYSQEDKLEIINLCVVFYISVMFFPINHFCAQNSSLSNVFFKERANNSLFDYKSLSDGIDRSNLTTKKWNIALVDYAGAKYPLTYQKTTSDYYGLGDSFEQNYFLGLREWGYSFHHLYNHRDGAGNLIISAPNFGYNEIPSSANDALNLTKAWFLNQISDHFVGNKHFITKNGHYFYHHYGAKWYSNLDIISAEVGENILSVNAHMAFTRGKNWGIDLSSWWGASIRDYTASWIQLEKDVVEFQIEGDRIGVVKSGNNFYVKEGGLNSDWMSLGNNIEKFELNDNRIGILNTAGEFFVKEGALGSEWVKMGADVKDFSLNGNRIAMLKLDENLYVKEGDLSAAFEYLADIVNEFKLDGERIGIIQTDGAFKVKEGQLNSDWIVLDSPVNDFVLDGNRIVILKEDGSFYRQEGSLSVDWINLANNVVGFQIEGDRVAIMKSDKSLQVKSWMKNDDWTLAADSISEFQLDATRIAYVENTKRFYFREGVLSGNSIQIFDMVDKFQVKDGRITVTLSDGQLLAKAGEINGNESGVVPYWSVGSPAVGHSISLSKRVYYYSYMGGANVLYSEAGSIYYFHTNAVFDGKFILSPVGRIGQDIYNFSHNVYPNRGIPWIPVGIVLNEVHGLGLTSWDNRNEIFSGFPMDEKDLMNKYLLKTIWGESLVNHSLSNEYSFQQNNELGEIFDVLLEDVSLDVLTKYPVIILSGNININSTMKQKLIDYVNAGGNLVVNIEYLEQSSKLRDFAGVDSDNTINNLNINKITWSDNSISEVITAQADVKFLWPRSGTTTLAMAGSTISQNIITICEREKGKLITVGFPYLRHPVIWKSLLNHIVKDKAVVPFRSGGDIQYLFNNLDDEKTNWAITLINNKGVKKTNTGVGEIIHSFDENVTLTFQEPGKMITDVFEFTSSSSVPTSENKFSIHIPVEELRIVKVLTEETTTGIENGNFDSDLFLYPNPTTSFVQFNKEVEKVQIFNVSGSAVQVLHNVSSVGINSFNNGDCTYLKLKMGIDS